MKVIVADKDEYIRFNARLLNKLNTFELTDNTSDYIIHRVKLGKDTQDVSLMDSCINNLLDKQYERREYIKLEELEEIDDLICGLSKEECHILNAYAEVKEYNIKDLNEVKELVANINDYKILPKYNLHEVGILIAEKVHGYKMDINVIPYMNFTELAKNYLFDANIKEDFCSYGLLVNTRKMLDNELIEAKIDNDKILKLEVTNKKEYEESDVYSKVIIYLPTSEERLREKFKRINLDYDKATIQDTHVTKCEITNFNNEELSENFNILMKRMLDKFEKEEGNTTPFQEIKLLCKEIKKFDNTKMSKFLALMSTRDYQIKYIRDLVEYAKRTKDYELLPDVKDLKDMGKYLVNETGHFDDVSLLQDYINYYKLADDYTKKGCTYNGLYTQYGYLMEKEFIEKENKKEMENEEEFE